MTSRDAGQANKGIPDDELLQYAVKLNRCVITYNRKDKSYEEPKKVVETKIVTKIVYDTVKVKVPKQKITPKINIEPKKLDTNIIKDSL